MYHVVIFVDEKRDEVFETALADADSFIIKEIMRTYRNKYEFARYELHVFTKSIDNIASLLLMALDLTEKHSTLKSEKYVSKYGYEKLGVDAGDCLLFLRFSDGRYFLLERRGDVDLEKLSNYRRRNITIETSASDTLKKAVEIVSEFSDDAEQIVFSKTRCGLGARIRLSRELDASVFEKKSRLDSITRVERDIALTTSGFTALTNTLFNVECEYSDSTGKFTCYSEEQLTVTSIELDRIGKPKINIPRLDMGSYYIENNVVYFKTPVSLYDGVKVALEILDDPIKYLRKTFGSMPPEEAIKVAYCTFTTPEACDVVKNSRIAVEDDIALIYVPEIYDEFIGYLIGKEGRNVKYIEQLVGVKIKIYSPALKRDSASDLRRKLSKLMKTLAKDINET